MLSNQIVSQLTGHQAIGPSGHQLLGPAGHQRRVLVATCALAAIALLMPPANAQAQTPPPLPAAENGTQYLVFFRAQPVGREEVVVLRIGDGFVVRGTSRLGPPMRSAIARSIRTGAQSAHGRT